MGNMENRESPISKSTQEELNKNEITETCATLARCSNPTATDKKLEASFDPDGRAKTFKTDAPLLSAGPCASSREYDLLPPNKQSEECPICQELVHSLKFLRCEHAVCEKCLQSISTIENNEKVVKCPFDRTITKLPHGKVESLKSKLLLQLQCERCDLENSISRLWWCISCQLTLCSNCAMKKHRTHLCNPWEDYDVVADCANFYKRMSARTPEECEKKRQEVIEFCSEIQKVLLEAVDEEESAWKAIASIEQIFGSSIAQKEYNGCEMDKKLRLISQILAAFRSDATLITDFNGGFCHPVKLPLTKHVLRLCFNHSSASSAVSASISSVGPTSAIPKTPADQNISTKPISALQSVQTTSSAAISKSNFPVSYPGVKSLTLLKECLLPALRQKAQFICLLKDQQFALINDVGIYVINFDNTVVKQKGWSDQTPKTVKYYPSHMTFRESDNLIFVTRADSNNSAGVMYTYCPKNLSKLGFEKLPGSRRLDDIYPRLLCVSTDNSLLLATGDGINSIIWRRNKQNWAEIWKETGKLQPFLFLHRLISETATNVILIAGKSVVYKFSFTAQLSFQSYQVINLTSGPIIEIGHSVFVFDTTSQLFRRVLSNEGSTETFIYFSLHDRLSPLMSSGNNRLIAVNYNCNKINLFELK